MEAVDLVQGEDVDEGLDLVDREEVAAAVEHRAAVGERRFVLDAQRRERRAVLGDKLPQALQTVEDPGLRAALDQKAVGPDRKPIGLGTERLVERQAQRAVALRHGEPQPRFALHPLCKLLRHTEQHDVVRRDGDSHAVGQLQAFAPVTDGKPRLRHKGRRCGRKSSGSRQRREQK